MTTKMENKIAQIGTDWQDGVPEPLYGEEEAAARNYINGKLLQWGIAADDDNLNDYIVRAWDEWITTDEASSYLNQ